MEVTETFDADGVLTGRSVTRRQAEWDEESRNLLLALLEYEAGLCPGCGHPLAETTNPLMEGRYLYDGFVECFHCLATAVGSEKATKDHKHPHAVLHDVKALTPRLKPLGVS